MEAGPLGRSGYRLRSTEDDGSRAGKDGGERWRRERRHGSHGKSNLLSLILSFIKSNNVKCSHGNKAGRLR